jgi:hypothetical protein
MKRTFSLPLALAILLPSFSVVAQTAPASPSPQVTPSATAAAQPAPGPASPPASAGLDLRLPLKSGSFRFAVIGDNGTGKAEEFEIGEQMMRYWQAVKFDTVVMLGDNIYGGHKPADFVDKFERPYKTLLDAGVKFYASLGNHDDPDIERNYKPFNMNGQRFYTLKKGDVEFFVLDSNYMSPEQLAWLQRQLKDSNAKWKIAYFHHPLFSDGKFHGSDLDLRARLLPIFQSAGLNLVLSGHDHLYERLKPQDGIYFFVLGSSGQLRPHDLRRAPDIASGDDTDRTFMLMEIAGDTLYFQTINNKGATVDSGSYARQNFGSQNTAK